MENTFFTRFESNFIRLTALLLRLGLSAKLLWRLKMIGEVTSAAHLLFAHFISLSERVVPTKLILIKLWTDDEHICSKWSCNRRAAG